MAYIDSKVGKEFHFSSLEFAALFEKIIGAKTRQFHIKILMALMILLNTFAGRGI